MTQEMDKAKTAILTAIKDEVSKSKAVQDATQINKFIQQFYSTAALDDLHAHDINDLYGSAIAFWNFIRQRKVKERKIRIYNPDYERDGWQSTHTILEIVLDDMPFIVDSVLMEINKLGLTSHFIIHLGGVKVRRKANKITEILPIDHELEKDIRSEALVYIEITRQTDPDTLEKIVTNLQHSLNDVEMAVRDWQEMRKQVTISIKELDKIKVKLDPDELSESKDFLRWIEDHHFTFLGVRDYFLKGKGKNQVLEIVPKSGLGVLHDVNSSHISRSLASMTPEARKLILSPQILTISKTNTPSTVHRPTYTDYIGIKLFDAKGNVIGERRIIGLYTSAAYNTNPKHIPFLRRKVSQILKSPKIPPTGHARKVMLNILETLPRDDLFQTNVDELTELAMGIYHMQERRRIRLFARRDIYGRFISCLVYVPRERFNTELRLAMQDHLMEVFCGTEVFFSTRFSESVLARIHFVIRVENLSSTDYDLKEIEQRLVSIGRSWEDELTTNLVDYFGEEVGNQYANNFVNAFSASYREFYLPRSAVYDIRHVQRLITGEKMLEMNLYKPIDASTGTLRLKLYQENTTIPLSDVLPILENMGMRVISERPNEIITADKHHIWINDFGMVSADGRDLSIDTVRDRFQKAFARIWCGEAESDGFNTLLVNADLNWKEISVLRAIAKYLRQVGFTFSQDYIEETMVTYPHIALALVKLFKMRFHPDDNPQRALQVDQIKQQIIIDLDKVANLNQDRTIQRYLHIILAILRTNYFQTNGQGKSKPYLSFKLSPEMIPDLPLPLPKFEVFVYSPRFEGTHLRAAKVARGGLRWSDRREDFRTEVLGLMKAQQVKNAVIVPSGAKGGFFPKCLPLEEGREAIMKEGIACYKDFIRGLLDITDNQVEGDIIKPENIVCYDEDDPYLVVAADKGTATFSDMANEISCGYGFWLGDAFASGGSTGYDHKKMGITARGAWESVKRLFREIGRDIQTSDFTVVGIGDMAGDVFGNGMLLSKHTKLVGAFNHLHIFLDPDPNPAVSFKERQRLFNLPRSSWSDYDEKLISKGGGVFDRSAKSIKLSPEIKKLFDLEQDIIIPSELLRAMLKAPIDLLWNGGIGTFVKAESETHLDVGDRTNDAIRVNATELHCKVVGEGGNLGLTQLSRVEYALGGGLVYSDFIDNSAGVDCSDHEVNIKIMLNEVVNNGDMTEKQRNQLLAKMTDEVADLVLLNNYRQTQAISLAATMALKNIELHSRYLDELERSGKIDRSLEFLPDEKALAERKLQGKGLLRPGLAVLLAYSKSILKEQILESELPEDPFLSKMLQTAFPDILSKRYLDAMEHHSLRREIIATQLSNTVVNEMGFTFIYRLYDETGAPPAAIVRAYTVAHNIFELDSLWFQIEALDNKIATELQFDMMMILIRLTRRTTRWLLRNRRHHFDIAEAIDTFKPPVKALKACITKHLLGAEKAHFEKMTKILIQASVPEQLAIDIVSCRPMLSAMDIIYASFATDFSVEDITQVYFTISYKLDISWLREQVIKRSVENHWEALSREALRDDLDWQQRLLTLTILRHECSTKDLTKRIKLWLGDYKDLIKRWEAMLAELRKSTSLNFTMFFVAIRELLDLTQTCMQRNPGTLQETPQKPLVSSNVKKKSSGSKGRAA